MLKFIKENWINKEISIYPLVTFRILFGFLMAISAIRFWAKGWIETQYLQPTFFFKYYGFHWIPNPSENSIYLVFLAIILSSIFIALGLFYRFSITLFFLLFSYTELIDATNYLNHYYFISLIAFLLLFLPANQAISLDNFFYKRKEKTSTKAWHINILKIQIGCLYFFAGLAKLNYDWMVNAMPLKLWLPAKANLPLIGNLLNYTSTAYLFSWAGAFFDLCIVFFLIKTETRTFAYVAVVLFHISTWVLFPIGMFPFLMIGLTLLFFSEKFHQSIYQFFGANKLEKRMSKPNTTRKISLVLMTIYLSIQLILPFRYVAYPNKLFWTEQGYRFSWRVMLMEKVGYATFYVSNKTKKMVVENDDFLTPNQEKMMATQPDFIIQYAHFLADYYAKKGFENPKVTADVYVTLNGTPSQLFIDNKVNLASINDSFFHKNWILPFKEH